MPYEPNPYQSPQSPGPGPCPWWQWPDVLATLFYIAVLVQGVSWHRAIFVDRIFASPETEAGRLTCVLFAGSWLVVLAVMYLAPEEEPTNAD